MGSPWRQHIKLALSELTLAMAAILHAVFPALRHACRLASSWALTPSAILQDNLAQADKQTPSSVQRGTLMKPIPTIINSKVMDSNQHNLRLISLMGVIIRIHQRSRLKKMPFFREMTYNFGPAISSFTICLLNTLCLPSEISFTHVIFFLIDLTSVSICEPMDFQKVMLEKGTWHTFLARILVWCGYLFSTDIFLRVALAGDFGEPCCYGR